MRELSRPRSAVGAVRELELAAMSCHTLRPVRRQLSEKAVFQHEEIETAETRRRQGPGRGWRKCTAYRQTGPGGPPLGLNLSGGVRPQVSHCDWKNLGVYKYQLQECGGRLSSAQRR